jgi:hypothetical protein
MPLYGPFPLDTCHNPNNKNFFQGFFSEGFLPMTQTKKSSSPFSWMYKIPALAIASTLSAQAGVFSLCTSTAQAMTKPFEESRSWGKAIKESFTHRGIHSGKDWVGHDVKRMKRTGVNVLSKVVRTDSMQDKKQQAHDYFDEIDRNQRKLLLDQSFVSRKDFQELSQGAQDQELSKIFNQRKKYQLNEKIIFSAADAFIMGASIQVLGIISGAIAHHFAKQQPITTKEFFGIPVEGQFLPPHISSPLNWGNRLSLAPFLYYGIADTWNLWGSIIKKIRNKPNQLAQAEKAYFLAKRFMDEEGQKKAESKLDELSKNSGNKGKREKISHDLKEILKNYRTS